MSSADELSNLFQQLSVHDRIREPFEWAIARFRFGVAIFESIVSGQSADAEPAIVAFLEALDVWTLEEYPQNWALTKFNLGQCLLKRQVGSRSENIEHAITEFQEALNCVDRNVWPGQWASLQDVLGQAFRQRIKGNPAKNVETAIYHTRRALELRTPERGLREHVLTLNNLANAYLDRIEDDPAENVQQAVELYLEAAALFENSRAPAEPEVQAIVYQNLGLAFRDRLYGDPEQDRKRALHYLEKALSLRPREEVPFVWASTLLNLGSVFLIQRLRDIETYGTDIEKALGYFQSALQVLDEDATPHAWAMAKLLTAEAYVELSRVAERDKNLQNAIACLEAALRVRNRSSDALGWAQVQQELGNTYSMLPNTEKAIAAYYEALEVFTPDIPFEHRRTMKNIAHTWLESGHFDKALEAYKEAMDTGEDLLALSYTTGGKQAEAAEISAIYPNAAYALVELGRYGEALEMLERGKTRLMAEELSLQDIALEKVDAATSSRIQGLRDRYRADEMDFIDAVSRAVPEIVSHCRRELAKNRVAFQAELRALRREKPDVLPKDLPIAEILELVQPGECLVAPLLTAFGTVIFILPSGCRTVREENVIRLDLFPLYEMLHPRQPAYTADFKYELQNWLYWYGILRSDTSDETRLNREEALDKLLSMLWNALIDPIFRRANDWGATTLLILPQGGLQLFPLHAAWRVEAGKRRYLLEDYVVCYAPSAFVIHRCRIRATPAVPKQLLCSAVEHYKDFLRLRPLPFALLESSEVARITNAKLLVDRAANVDAVIKNAGSFTHLHFACHATYSQDPLATALQLGGWNAGLRDELSVWQIANKLDLRSTRLVVLAACQSGVIEHLQSADEYIGLPGAFLQAGSVGVISSLFAVHDLASCLLWRRFYELHWVEGVDPAKALCAAQIWLSHLTDDDVKSIAALWQTSEPAATDEAAHMASSRLPFAHPMFWAGFTYAGS